ncbi:MAG TPA: c-type cytochrome [Methylovirgula sp.]|jgi:cytochrome c2|nr:c-type cytochrome [Methylovirgula sp.]
MQRLTFFAPFLALVLVVPLSACDRGQATIAANGDAHHGAKIIRQLGCGNCHTIPGVADARGNVGPPLTRIADRAFIAGVLPNTPENMRAWIRAPQTIVPGNAMPDMGIDEADARDIAAYLYTLH